MSVTSKTRHIDIITPLKETTSDSAHLVKISEEILREVTDGDDNPQFVVVEFGECTSDNNVHYDRDFFVNLCEQINEKQPPGYLGHKHFQGMDKEDLLPDPQVVWLAATVSSEGGKAKLTAKGYLLPPSEGGKARAWIKRQAINSVSWSADAVLTLGKDGSYRVKEFFLESIDFARKNRAGVRNQRLQVVTEMEGGGIKVDDDDVGRIVGRLTFHELNESNPTLVKAIKEMAKDEVKDETATAVQAKEDELTTQHKQEIDNHPEITMMQKVKAALGITDDPNAKPDEVVVSLLERLDAIGKDFVQNWFNTEILEKKVPNEKARKLVARLVPVKEMKGDYRTEKGIEKIKKELEDNADNLLDNDEEIQTVIKEMAASRGGPRLSSRDGHDRHDRRDNNDNNDELKDTENVRVEKVRVG